MHADQPRRAYKKNSLRKLAKAGTNKLIIGGEALEEEKVSPSSINNLLSLDFDGNCLDESCNNKMNQQQATNESLCAITNIIIKKRSSNNPVLSSSCRAQCLQTMYKSTTTKQVARTTDRQRRRPAQMKPFKQALRRQRPALNVGGQSAALITISLLIVCTCSLIFAGSGEAFAFTEGSSAANAAGQMLHELTGSNKQPLVASNGIERADKLASSDQPVASSSPSSPPSGQSSVVASLSSAIASAAAAATVAAAQSALTGSDARSLLNGNHQAGHHQHHHGSALAHAAAGGPHPHQQRSPGIHLALKLADAIPEVPYNILHNMKKLDHAAPFYNVANKMTGTGTSKESSHGLSLANALASTSNAFGAEQLRALFQSPLWKRIADGYGEFTSEFRSLFRAPAHPMKGPTSTTTKLLRDLSVPAMLMLLASAIPNDVSIASLSPLGAQLGQPLTKLPTSDQWLPVKTRRKSLLTPATDLANNQLSSLVDPLSLSGSSEVPNYSISPPFGGSNHLFPRSLTNNQNAAQNNYQAAPSQISRVFNGNQGDIYRQPSGLNSELQQGWVSAQQQVPSGFDSTPAHPLQRVGESAPTEPQAATPVLSGSTKRDMKPVKRSDRKTHSSPASLLNQAVSSLTFFANQPTSAATGGSGKLMSKLMNANGNQQFELGNSYRMMSLGSGSDATSASATGVSFALPWQRMSTNARSDNQLDEKHRYSLVEDSDSLAQFKTPFKSWNPNSFEEQQEKLSPSSSLSSKPFLLSAMTQAISSMFNGAPQTGATGGHLYGSESGFPPASNSKLESLGDKTIINQHNKESVLRRQLVGGNQINNIGALAEQRELSQLLPQSWREVVKRTVNSVKQEASTQWRSIEGQLTSWVQDKLKSLPTGGSPAPASSASGASPTPVANLIATVSNTAMNLLGITGNKAGSVLAGPHPAAHAASSDPASLPAESASSSSSGGKHDSPSRAGLVQPAKSALLGVSNMIVNTLTNRQVATTAAASSPSSSAPASAPKVADNQLTSSVSQYPTLTGAQASQQVASPTSVASGIASSSVAQLVQST